MVLSLYSGKLTEIIANNYIKSIMILGMER